MNGPFSIAMLNNQRVDEGYPHDLSAQWGPAARRRNKWMQRLKQQPGSWDRKPCEGAWRTGVPVDGFLN